ncbi:MAG: YlzJ-like family protein [Firmicutes bacterium]|nr:YlzJ-like family protein [[Eubacterium] siraeum]MCM1487231.1 YlzJ-like family protein [Bacillota bacterium]
MLHTIINQYDIFFDPNSPKYLEKKRGSGVMTMIMENGKYKPHCFFSTDPADYLKKENQI